MYQYTVWVRLNAYQTAHTIVWASYAYEAKLIAEAQYGAGNVLSYYLVND